MGEPERIPGEPVVGLSGARFPTARQRAKLDGGDEADPPARNGKKRRRNNKDRVGRSGARFPSAGVLEKYAEPEPEPPEPAPEPPPATEETVPEEPLPVDDGIRVRPYVLTGGRTRGRRKLALETLVAVPPGGDRAGFTSPEFERVLLVCRQPRSVAEIAAQLSVPLGVAQVLIGDLAAAGRVIVHATATTGDGRPDLGLMYRVLDGLKRL